MEAIIFTLEKWEFKYIRMKNIGLVTLYERNYGSSLQCYALKCTIEKMNYHCDVIGFSNQGVDKYLHYVGELKTVAWNSLRYRGYYADYRKTRSARIHYSHSLSKESAHRLWMFTETVLQAQKFSSSTLRILGNDNNYVRFIAGSDQVWNGHKNINPNYFLRFAPEAKRMALSASFGADSVPDYNRKQISKYISEIPDISVREVAGQRIIEDLTGRKVELLSDPTVLLDAEEWRHFAHNGIRHSEPYIFAHFLDAPSDTVINEISSYANEKGLDILLFAYPHEEVDEDKHFKLVDGGPEDYVSLIDEAEFVCTESLHSVLFSINLETKFIVYPRRYRHDHPQMSRIETLLYKYGYTERMGGAGTTIDAIAEMKFHDCKSIIAKEKEKLLTYLHKNLMPISENEVFPRLKDYNDCTGCGVCSIVCPHHAITMQPDKNGSYSPVISHEKCVKCGICEKSCLRDIPMTVDYPQAFIGYNIDDMLAQQSASGGIFSAIAAEIIQQGGIVYGAAIDFNRDGVQVIHKEAGKQEELLPLLKSKYVQSECSNVFKRIQQKLSDGVVVLFCGTSCQVNALYRYLGKREYRNLYTMDLICHGVPGQKLFSDYIDYLGKKKGSRVKSFDFRTKRDGAIQYEMKVGYEDLEDYEYIQKMSSSYYRLFMSMNSYRICCYHCEYASLFKPADITVGDYFEIRDDYPDIYERELKDRYSISSVLVHNSKGEELVSRYGQNIRLIPVDAKKVQTSHGNLRKPSQYTSLRKTVFTILQQSGFEGVERYFKKRDVLLFFPKFLLNRK